MRDQPVGAKVERRKAERWNKMIGEWMSVYEFSTKLVEEKGD